MTRQDKNIPGFTVVELLLALSFVGFILIFIVFATVQVMRSYSKGIAIKEINQSARSILEDISRVARTADGARIIFLPGQSRMCFGGVSYVWNTQGGTNNKNDDNTPVTIARVSDSSSAMCSISGTPDDILPRVAKSASTSILSDRIWAQNIDLQQSADKNLATITVRLSTTDSNRPTYSDPTRGLICSGDSNGQYCAVSIFSTSVVTRKSGQ
jgi:hypothetical protein